MKTKKHPRKQFEFLINIGTMALGSGQHDIIELFSNQEMCSIYEYKNGRKVCSALELQFDIANLTCMFDERSGLCYMSILYVEQLDHIAEYIRYCDNAFAYDSIFHFWYLEDINLRIKHSDNRIAFIQDKTADSIAS